MSEKWVPYFDHDDACVYNTSVKLEGGHNEVCGCAQFDSKREAQQMLLARLILFVERNQAIVDDAVVRIAQIKEAMEGYPYNAAD